MSDTWAYVAVKGDHFGGVISPEVERKDLRKFIADCVLDGYEIIQVKNRDEYNAILARCENTKGVAR